MRSLFLKIFLWFWMAMALVVVVFAVLVANTQGTPPDRGQGQGPDGDRGRGPEWGRDRFPGPRPMREVSNDTLIMQIQAGANILEKAGHGALINHLQRMESTGRMRAFLFNERGEQLFHPTPVSDNPQINRQPPGQPLPQLTKLPSQELNALVQRAAQSDDLQLITAGPILLAAQRARAKATVADEKVRRQAARAALDAKIGYTKQPRLATLLTAMGLISDEVALLGGIGGGMRGGPGGFGGPGGGPGGFGGGPGGFGGGPGGGRGGRGGDNAPGG